MAFTIQNQASYSHLSKILARAQAEKSDAMEKLATGSALAGVGASPSDRYLSEKMDQRIRSLNASTKNINDAVLFTQSIDSSIGEISNMMNRMKELNLSAVSPTISDQERRYLFIEYQALHDEINRISKTTEFNGIPILDPDSEIRPKEIHFRVDDPYKAAGVDEDINLITFGNLDAIATTTNFLGLKSASSLLEDSTAESGVAMDVAEELILSDDEKYPTVYDKANFNINHQRALFGAMQGRMQRSLDFMDVYKENIAAAKSKVTDVDYIDTVSKFVESSIKSQATTSLLAQASLQSEEALHLLKSVL